MAEPHLWATLTQHDSVIFQDDDFEVFIDPNGDSHEYYEFEINALGTGWDLLLPAALQGRRPAVDDWEIPGLKTAVHLDGTLNDPARHATAAGRSSWPFPGRRWASWRAGRHRPATATSGASTSRASTGRCESSAARTRRSRARKENNWVWSPQGVVNMHRPETWGYVQFATGRPGTASLPARPHAARAPLAARGLLRATRSTADEHKRWARTLEELGVAAPRGRALAAARDGSDRRTSSRPRWSCASPADAAALEHPAGRPGLAGLRNSVDAAASGPPPSGLVARQERAQRSSAMGG